MSSPTLQDKVKDFCKYFRPQIKELNDLLSYNKIFIKRTANVGVLPAEVAINYAVSGPVLRGSGVQWDLRKNDPYSVYDRLDFEIPVGKGLKGTVGDCWDRYMVRVHEMEQSVNIIEQAVEKLPAGDVPLPYRSGSVRTPATSMSAPRRRRGSWDTISSPTGRRPRSG
jgi:NADH-quinone oxidoreductase subunit D